MTKQILVLNGPNLNLLGQREPEKYGSKTLADVASELAAIAPALDVTVWMAQSNSEGTLIDHIHTARDTCAGIIINAGGYTHTSVAIMDALNAFDGPVIELHVTDIYAREQFRHHSYIAMRADKGIVGEGTDGYSHALREIAEMV
ncbi:MAG: 3-dehydroquinate dehydratase [Yoonia sp.]|jgi:3-dehydroquinate dehydratase-2|nr:3-dehydroquinate dehydratase [Yoonia sp.]MDG1518881.1 3-dehydroquinate dehydratase [Yoonia sp.]MDG1769789.1 3-dehydroquinate dehydratase [Yoonia sp.]MDG1868907.1 3-dehydroquinate dehydratase [Yoonia sp.]